MEEPPPGWIRRAVFTAELRALVRSGRLGASFRSTVIDAILGGWNFTPWWQAIAHAAVVTLGLNKRAHYLQSVCALRRALIFCMRASPPTPPGRLVAASARVLRGPDLTTDRTFPIGGVAVA